MKRQLKTGEIAQTRVSYAQRFTKNAPDTTYLQKVLCLVIPCA